MVISLSKRKSRPLNNSSASLTGAVYQRHRHDFRSFCHWGQRVKIEFNLVFFLIYPWPYWFPASYICTQKYINNFNTLPLSSKSHLYYLFIPHYTANFPSTCSTSKGNTDQKKNLSISYHSAILNGSQYLYIMLSTLQYHYRLNSSGCKKYHSEHKACNSNNEKRVVSVFQQEWKIKITKALSSKENWQIKGTKIKYSWLILWNGR